MLNQHQLIGRIGQDPETNQVNDSSVTKFSLATTESWKDSVGNKKERTEWHNIEAWGKVGEVIKKYSKKGDLIYVSGSVHHDSYEKEGVKMRSTKVKLKDFKFIPTGTKSAATTNEDENLPF